MSAIYLLHVLCFSMFLIDDKIFFLTISLLCMNKVKHAQQVFERYVENWSRHQHQSMEVLDTPLLNYLRAVQLSIQVKSLPLFRRVSEQYRSELVDRDSDLQKYITGIAEVHFGVKRQDNGLSGMLGSLMQSFFGGSSSNKNNK